MQREFEAVAARRVTRGKPLSDLEVRGTPPSPSEWYLSPEYRTPLSTEELRAIVRGDAQVIDFVPAPEHFPEPLPPRFPMTYCSSCGNAFGPGNHGFSRCRDHAGLRSLDV